MNGNHNINLKQLRVLDNLLKETNLSRVADKMGLTQQAVSEHLRKLRALFNDRLFIRQGNTMVATPKAIEIGSKISQILLRIDGLFEMSEFDPIHYQGEFTISATDYAIQCILPQLLHTVRQESPGLKIIIRDFETRNISQLFTSGELDLALTFPEFCPESLYSTTLFKDQHILIAGAHSAFKNRTLSLEEVAQQPQLVISPSIANLKGSHDSWFATQGLTRNIVMSVPSFSSAPDILYTTDLLAFYPSQLLPNNKIIPVAVEVCPPPFDVIAAWHPRTNHSPVHRWILEKLKNLTQDMHYQAIATGH